MSLNYANIVTRSNGLHDFEIRDSANGNLLCSSNQGYEHRGECIDIAKRVLFGPADMVIHFDAHDTEEATHG